jgi:hypothetical protein
MLFKQLKMKKIFTLAFSIALSVNTFAQFFDSVPYRGAFGIKGGTREITPGYAGYNPDPSNTDADWTKPWAEFARKHSCLSWRSRLQLI